MWKRQGVDLFSFIANGFENSLFPLSAAAVVLSQ